MTSPHTDERRVVYRVVSDFASLAADAHKAREEIRALKAEEGSLAVQGHTAATAETQVRKTRTQAVKEGSLAVQGHTAAVKSDTQAVEKAVSTLQRAKGLEVTPKLNTHPLVDALADFAKDKATLSIEADTSKAEAKLDSLAAQHLTKELELSADDTEYRRRVEELRQERPRAGIDVEADTTKAEEKTDSFRKKEKKTPVKQDVDVDTAAAAAALEAWRKAQAARKAKIDLEDPVTAAWRAKLEAGLRSAAKNSVKIPITSDTEKWRADLVATVKFLSHEIHAEIPVEPAKAAKFRAELEALVKAVQEEVKVRIPVDDESIKRSAKKGKSAWEELKGSISATAANMAQAFRTAERGTSVMDRLGASIKAAGSSGGGGGFRNIFGDLIGGAGAAGDAIGKLVAHVALAAGKFIVLLSAISPLITVVGAAAGGVLGLASSLGSLAGAAAALPALLAAMISGIGAILLAVAPFTAAFKAFTAQQEAASQAAQTAAQDQRAAARELADANHTVSESEYALGQAQDSVRRAQKDLNDARKEATRQLQDLREEVARAGLDEEGAVLALKRAELEYKKTLADPTKGLLDRQEALHRVREAEFSLADVRKRNRRNVQDLAEAERKGVEGSDQVVAAKDALRAAQKGAADSAYALRRAVEALADAQRRAQVPNSALAEANHKLQRAMDKLSPSAQTVVKALFGMSGSFRELSKHVQEGLFQPIVGQLGNLKLLLPVVDDFLTRAASSIGKVVARGIEMAASGPWRKDLGTLAQSNARIIESLGNAALYTADAFRNIAVAAAPFTEWLAKGVEKLAKSFADWSAKSRGSGNMSKFFDELKPRMQVVGHILGNLLKVILNFGKASLDFGDWMLRGLSKASDGWVDFSKKQTLAGSKFKTWLENIKPLLHELGRLIKAVAVGFVGIASDPKNIQMATEILRHLADDVIPKLFSGIDKLGKTGVFDEIVKSVGNLVRAFDDFLSHGGGGGIATFFKVLANILKFIVDIGAAPVFGAIAVSLGAIAAVSIAGRFLGIFKLIRGLAWLVKNKGKLSFAGIFDKMFGGGKGGKLGDEAGLKGAATALDRSAVALDRAAVALTRAAAAEGAGGTAAGRKGKAAKGAAEAEGAALSGTAGKAAKEAEKEAVKEGSRLSRIVKGFFGGLGKVIGGLFALLLGDFGPIVSLAKGIGSRLASMFRSIGSGIGSAASGTGRLARSLATRVGSFFSGLGSTVASAARGAPGAARSLAARVGTFFTSLGSTVAGAIRAAPGAARSLASRVGTFFSTVGSWLATAGRGAAGLAGKVGSGVASFFGSIASGVASAGRGIGGLASRIGGAVSGLFSSISGAISGAGKGVGGWGTRILGVVTSLLTLVWQVFLVAAAAFIGFKIGELIAKYFIEPVGKWLGEQLYKLGLGFHPKSTYENATPATRAYIDRLGREGFQRKFGYDPYSQAFPGQAAGGEVPEGISMVGELGPEWAVKSGSRVEIIPMDAKSAAAARVQAEKGPGANSEVPGYAWGTDFGARPRGWLPDIPRAGTQNFLPKGGEGASYYDNSTRTTNKGALAIGKVLINNPVPEKAGESLHRAIQKINYFAGRRP